MKRGLNNKQNQIILANLLTIGAGILNEISGNAISTKNTGNPNDACRVLAVRLKSNLSKYQGDNNA